MLAAGPPSVRAGSAVPVKFNLGGAQGLAIFAPGFPVSREVVCGTMDNVGDGSPTANPGNSGLSYDAGSQQYTYVWKTKREWGGTCRVLTVQLVDGPMHDAYFQFR